MLSQPALGKQIGVEGQSVSRWEKTDSVPLWADKLIRLFFVAHAQGNEPIRRSIERIKTVERLVHQRIVVKESQGHWNSNFQQDEEMVQA